MEISKTLDELMAVTTAAETQQFVFGVTGARGQGKSYMLNHLLMDQSDIGRLPCSPQLVHLVGASVPNPRNK